MGRRALNGLPLRRECRRTKVKKGKRMASKMVCRYFLVKRRAPAKKAPVKKAPAKKAPAKKAKSALKFGLVCRRFRRKQKNGKFRMMMSCRRRALNGLPLRRECRRTKVKKGK